MQAAHLAFRPFTEQPHIVVPDLTPISPVFVIFKNYLYKILDMYGTGKVLGTELTPLNLSLTLRNRTFTRTFKALWAPPPNQSTPGGNHYRQSCAPFPRFFLIG